MTSSILASITFRPTVDDYVAVHAFALVKSTNDYRRWARWVLVIASWSATAVSLVTADALTPKSATFGALCSATFILIFTRNMWPDPEKAARQRYDPRRNPSFFSQRTVQLEQLGIRQIGEQSEHWFNWSAIKSVSVTNDHLFIASMSMTFFIPVRSFATTDEFLALARIAQAHYTPERDDSNQRGFAVIVSEKKAAAKSR